MLQKRSKLTGMPLANSKHKPNFNPTKNVNKVSLKEVNLPPAYENELELENIKTVMKE